MTSTSSLIQLWVPDNMSKVMEINYVGCAGWPNNIYISGGSKKQLYRYWNSSGRTWNDDVVKLKEKRFQRTIKNKNEEDSEDHDDSSDEDD